MTEDEKKMERERKLRALELKIRMRKFEKLKRELDSVKNYLLSDIELMEQKGDELPEELKNIKADLMKY
ncbi:MAG: hypothetical protein GY866_19595 [Proteobacteria bacterium]|nr:hypothetical protein [Pseudomonadota bacterium]